MSYLIRFVDKYEKALKIFTAIAVAFITSVWAIVTLVYPDVIRPIFDNGKIKLEVTPHLVDENADYSLLSIRVDITNIGANRIYLPSTYCLVRAFQLSKIDQKSDKNKLQTTQTKASNDLFTERWKEVLVNGKYNNLNLRAPYNYKSELYVQLKALTSFYERLDKGEVTSDEFITIIPQGYQIAEIHCRSFVSKKNQDEYVFIPFFNSNGLHLFPFHNSENLSSELRNFPETIKRNNDSGFYQDIANDMEKEDSAHFEDRRIEFAIPELD